MIRGWHLSSGKSPSPVSQTKTGMLGAVARAEHDGCAERQKALELVELKVRPVDRAWVESAYSAYNETTFQPRCFVRRGRSSTFVFDPGWTSCCMCGSKLCVGELLRVCLHLCRSSAVGQEVAASGPIAAALAVRHIEEWIAAHPFVCVPFKVVIELIVC